jgi:6-phosphogluconate dehydrogenase
MVHNGIEYGMMASFAEGLNILHNANAGTTSSRGRRRDRAAGRARVLPVRHRHHGGDRSVATRQRDRVLAAGPDRRGPVRLPRAEEFAGRVSDSGEGRWTSIAAIDEGVPRRCSRALYSRFASRGLDDFANKVLSAMRKGFGGHDEKKA